MTSETGRSTRNIGSFPRKELGGALRNTEYTTRSFMCHIRPLWGLGFLRGALIQPQNQIS